MMAAHVLVHILEPERRRAVVDELEAAGHLVEAWVAGVALPPEARLLVIDGVELAAAAHDLSCDLVVLIDPDELPRLTGLARPGTDFVFKPLRPGEVAARVAYVCALEPLAERERQRILSLAAEASSDVIELTTPQARLLYVNRAYERTLGFSKAEVVGKTPAQLIRSDAHSPAFFRALDETLTRGDTWHGTLISRAKDGHYVHFDTSVTPVSDRRGQITHHVGIRRDVTEEIARREALLEANRALEQARDAAVSASRSKSEFLANMSHELRTPLNAIIGYSEMLMEDVAPGAQVHQDLMRIRSAGIHLLSLINDVLDISKIEADRFDLLPQRFALGELLAEVAATVEPLARTNHNDFQLRAVDEVGEIHADRTRLRQILLNLLGNAFKFTRKGTVILEADRIERRGRAWFELRVADTGIGITDEQARRVFQPFVQADASTTREYGGTGLGLAISKRLAELMGGEILLTSTPGAGSVFTVCLPADADDGDAGRLSRRAGEPLVLLIDDDPELLELFARQLGKRGFAVITADSGARGVELASSSMPDAIILDVKMPGMTGWEVLSTLKLAETTASIPVIMMTVLHQKEVGQTLGASDYLIKPIEPERLVETLRRHTQAATARVLVVEDDEPTRALIRRTLEHRGNVVAEADNGQVALDVLADARPDVIILDLMMPVMDGFGFLQVLRADPRYADLPVIVATARELDDDQRRDLARTTQQVIEKASHTRQELIGLISEEIVRLLARRDQVAT